MTERTVSDPAWAYFDSSALAKRYIQEAGRRTVLRLLQQYACVTSVFFQVELRSALSRRVADRTLPARRLPRILKRVAADRDYWTLVGVGPEVLSAAEGFVAAHSLRTRDAIHVASARLFATRGKMPELLFVSADKRQADAAAAAGLTVKLIAPP